MTKSGFYRFCLAKMLGYSEEDAKKLAEHRAVLNSIEQALVLQDKPAKTPPREPHPVKYTRLKKLKTP